MLFPSVKPLIGKFWYVVADIVLALNPFVKLVDPDTVPPVKVLEGKFWYVVADIVDAVTPFKLILLSRFKTTVEVPEIDELMFVPPDIVSVAFGFGAVIVVVLSPFIVVHEFDGGEDDVPSTNSNKSK